MYGVIARVKTGSKEDSKAMIRDVILPRARQLPGFAGGTWLQELDDDRGTAIMQFESEDDARAVAERIQSEGPLAGERVDLQSVDACEVLYETSHR
jgi:hypothetical protein